MPKVIFGYQMKMTVKLTVKMVRADQSSRRDNGLPEPLMIEWE
jgi:hypothetical protein